METTFNVGQILEIAERLEQNDILFYVRAAARFGDRQRRELCMALADWRASQKEVAAQQKIKSRHISAVESFVDLAEQIK